MSNAVALGMLRQGNNGNQILQILDAIVADIEQTNINDCADYYNAISYTTGEKIEF